MGCIPSKHNEDHVEVIHISGPIRETGPPRQVPTQPRDKTTNAPIKWENRTMDADFLTRYLDRVATFLTGRQKQITIVTVGGAVNTLYLRSREYTQDVDFFNGELNFSDLSLISKAASTARESATSDKDRPAGNWLNNAVMLLMDRQVTDLVTRLAIEQNVVVFERPNLKVLAAPWNYAICTKLDRISKQNHRSYDYSDAADYLDEYIEGHDSEAVTARTVREWTVLFKTTYQEKDLRRVAELYESRHGSVGVIF